MIVADDAHVTYQVYSSGKPVGARSKLLGQSGRHINSVPALRGVSFTATEGESVGVVGHNGSGKSTLFRALAGLIPTSEGSIWAADRPVLLGVNAALMPELSGEVNIKLGLLAMGFTPEEAASQVGEIADFAELNDFISHPMRTYSSGMGARLRFAIASARPHSILLLDEALAVGDRRFRQKSEERIRGLREAAGLVMIVSHSAGSLKDACERGLWIHKGELRADGPIKDVVDEYTRWSKDPTSVAVGAASKPKAVPAAVTTALPTVPETTSTKPVAVPGESPRTKARRDRYRSVDRRRSRRRILAFSLTGGAIIAAVGAGAAVALVANQSDRSELSEVRAALEQSASPTPTTTPTPTPTPVLPVINNFAASPLTIHCDTTESTAALQLSWDVAGAKTVSISTSIPDGSNSQPLLVDQPASVPAQSVTYGCYNEALMYTLVTQNAQGQQVTSSVVVVRDLAAAEVVPAPAPVDPAPTEDPAPVDPVPTEDPTTPVEPGPTENPVPEPDPTVDAPTDPSPAASG